MSKPFLEIIGARIRIDGKEMLLTIVPTDLKTQEQIGEFQRRFCPSGKFAFPFALATREYDGKIRAFADGEFGEKVQATIDAGVQWERIPFYEK